MQAPSISLAHSLSSTTIAARREFAASDSVAVPPDGGHGPGAVRTQTVGDDELPVWPTAYWQLGAISLASGKTEAALLVSVTGISQMRRGALTRGG